jgi:DNA-directed RNA polymerase sigma subunit (sigma70/sigma32)
MMVHAHSAPDFAHLSLGALIEVASAQPVLDDLDEGALVERAQQGDAEAHEMLVLSNLRVAIDEAIRTRGLGQPQRKLVPRGVSTLLEAIRTYDPAVDGLFSSYVQSRVRMAIRTGGSVS